MDNKAQTAAMDRAGELPLERRVAERRSNADIIGKMQADLDAYESLCQDKDATIAALKEEELSLHRQLAAEKLRADQGWQRYESANASHQSALTTIAALNRQLAAARNEALDWSSEGAAGGLARSLKAIADIAEYIGQTFQPQQTGVDSFDFASEVDYNMAHASASLAAEVATIRALASHPAAPIQPLGYISKFEMEVLEGGEAIGLTVLSEARKDRNVAIYAAPPVQQTGDVREAWEYSFTHSSATGKGDTEIGPCLTYDRSIAYGVGCFNQRQVAILAASGGAHAVPEDVSYELVQNDELVASTSGGSAWQEILRYAAQYEQDGPVEIIKCVRTPAAPTQDQGEGK